MLRQQRTVIVVAAVFAMLMGLEVLAQAAAHRAAQAEPASSGAFIDRVDQALAVRDITGAQRAGHDAYTAALGSRGWDELVAAGDAYLRIDEAMGFRSPARARARQAYLAAFLRARSQGSLDGVVRSTDAFASLGDRQVAAQCLRTAERLTAAGNDPRSREAVAALAERMAARLAGLDQVQAF